MKKVSNKCYDCGGARVTSRTGLYRMALAGDWSATIEDATLTHCPDCGGNGVAFESLGGIMRAITAAVVNKPGRLAAAEVVFLRKHLGFSGTELGKVLGVKNATVSRWENGHEPIGVVADRLLRALAVIRDEIDGFDIGSLSNIGDVSALLRLRVRKNDNGKWTADVATGTARARAA